MKLQLKRDANAARTARFLNARQRTIGLDVQALEAQILEKKMNHDDDKEMRRLESNNIFTLCILFSTGTLDYIYDNI